MQNKLNILIISPYLPTSKSSGCPRKIFDCIAALRDRGHYIYLLSFCSSQDRKKAKKIKKYCEESYFDYINDYSSYPRKSFIITQNIALLCKEKRINILQCENSYMSRYIPQNINVASILVEHEILSSSFAEKFKFKKNPVEKYILRVRKIKKMYEEKKWYKIFSKIIVFTKSDADVIHEKYKIKDVEVIPLGINLEDYPLSINIDKSYDLIFVGNFSHSPNIDGILYFLNHIWKLIKNEFPDLSMIIVGANPTNSIKQLINYDKNILVTGYVKNVIEYYNKSKISIAPLRYGTGMRFKILEAMALDMPIVSTSVGARGIISKNILIGDTAKDFADNITQLLINFKKHNYRTNTARLEVEKYYNTQILLQQYEKIYHSLLNSNKKINIL